MTTAATSGSGTGQPHVTLTYGYDNVGNRTSTTDSLSNTGRTTFGYDAADRLTTLTQSFGSTAGPVVTFAYDSGDRLTTILRTLGGSGVPITTTIVYDGDNRVTGITNAYGTTRLLNYFVLGTGYTYDSGGRVIAESLPTYNLTFVYDSDGEMTGYTSIVSGPVTRFTFTYNSTGNRNSTGYSTTTGNELSNAPGVTYTYDNDGNLISATTSSSTTTYTYDFRNRLISVEVGGTIVASYTYDALNRRIGIDDSGSQTWTVYDGSNAYADFNGSGTLTERYLYGPAVDELLARSSSGGTTDWYLTDKDGSVVNIVDSSDHLFDTIIYDPFGQIVSETAASNSDRFKYSAMEYDSAVGIYIRPGAGLRPEDREVPATGSAGSLGGRCQRLPLRWQRPGDLYRPQRAASGAGTVGSCSA